MVVRVPVQPATLAWAREALGLAASDVAKAAGTSPRQVAAWEAGTSSPTVNQLRALARRLDRTSAFFFLPPPEDTGVPEAPDFRGQRGGPVSAELLRQLKRAEGYRENYLQLAPDDSTPLQLAPITWENLEVRAAGLRRQLTSNLAEDGAVHTPGLNEWISALEDFGVLVFHSTGIDLSEYRAVSVFHETLSFIILNGADSQTARVFSLFHELCHIANRTGGLCLNLESSYEETLCNRFSAEYLMPRERVLSIVRRSRPGDAVRDIERFFGVSTLAAAIRLRGLDLIGEGALEQIRRESDELWERVRRQQAEGEGFVPPWRLRYRDLGRKYMRGVLRALDESRIDHVDASYLLNTRIPTVERLYDEMHRRGEL